MQVGQGNDQYSAYLVTLPSAALESSQALADQLLSLETPWSHDMFSHDAQFSLGSVSGGSSFAASGIVAGPGGDTLVIVRNSRAVQVGDHNVQHNQFRIRVTDVTVHADRLGTTSARRTAVARLREDPGDRGAARLLAQDVARVASRDLVVDLTAQVTSDLGPAQINQWTGEFRDLTGRQIGGPNQAHVVVHVTESKLESRALERQILKSAERQARLAARNDPPRVPSPGDLKRTPPPGPTRLPGPTRRPGPGGGLGPR